MQLSQAIFNYLPFLLLLNIVDTNQYLKKRFTQKPFHFWPSSYRFSESLENDLVPDLQNFGLNFWVQFSEHQESQYFKFKINKQTVLEVVMSPSTTILIQQKDNSASFIHPQSKPSLNWSYIQMHFSVQVNLQVSISFDAVSHDFEFDYLPTPHSGSIEFCSNPDSSKFCKE